MGHKQPGEETSSAKAIGAPEYRTGVIDLHSHLLSGLDDGARDLEEAIAMARSMVEDGARSSLRRLTCARVDAAAG